MALHTYFLPDIIAKCGKCPYVQRWDDDETRQTWLTLNNGHSAYDEGIDRFVNNKNVIQFRIIITKLAYELCEHLNTISDRLSTCEIKKINKEYVTNLILNGTCDELMDRELVQIIDLGALKTSTNFMDIIPLQIAKKTAATSLSGGLSFSWLKEIDELASTISITRLKKTIEERTILNTINDVKNVCDYQLYYHPQYGKFLSVKWKDMSSRAQADRILYYAHMQGKDGESTMQKYREYLEEIKENPKTKIKWSVRGGVIDKIECYVQQIPKTPKNKIVRKSKSKKITNQLTSQIETRQQELMILLLATPSVFKVIEKNGQINVTWLSCLVSESSPSHDEKFKNIDGIQDFISKALVNLEDQL